MTALLPPNLLRLFAPRPPVPYLQPLTKDESIRGPDRLQGIATIVTRLRQEAEDAELKAGMEDAKEVNGDAGEAEEDADKAKGEAAKSSGVIGQEAVILRRAARKKRQEEYKKTAEAGWDPNKNSKVEGDPYKTLFISRLVS